MTTQHDDLATRAGLTSGADTWHTKDAAGILPRLTLSDGPHGVRRQREGGDAGLHPDQAGLDLIAERAVPLLRRVLGTA